MVFADFTLGDALLTTLSIFFFVIWIWILITILTDLFRDHELSGWWKAVWVLFLVFVPFLTALIYLIARGSGMRERALEQRQETQKQFDAYVRQAAGGGGHSTAEELEKLHKLQSDGVITAEEYERQKAKLLA